MISDLKSIKRTFQIHISGIVQGVGFRPFVYNLAKAEGHKGWVCNTSSGVYIRINGNENQAEHFYIKIKENAPPKSIILSHSIQEVDDESFNEFSINQSFKGDENDRNITPDYASCPACLAEVEDKENRRYKYAFTTCSHCGPRYSIIDKLPYDREYTTMESFSMCSECQKEYDDPQDRRFFSQTNSCPKCGIKLSLYSYEKGFIEEGQNALIDTACKAIENGKIVAIKGIGGYMLLTDALNSKPVDLLRKRKNRPHKPFALLFQDEKMVEQHAQISPIQLRYFNADSAPIVLLKKHKNSSLPLESIAPGLEEIGALRPYSPLHFLIMRKLKRPLIATSANLSGSPIVYKDDEIVESMRGIADMILSHNREIINAQDDSVVRFANDQPIIIRRSRGLAPNTFYPKIKSKQAILAIGALLKSTYTILYKGNIIISPYIGDSNSYETQQSFSHNLKQMEEMLDYKSELVLSDKHPGYFSTEKAEEIASELAIPHYKIQHHEAHFAAILGEYDLWEELVLGMVWDGTGLGNDNHIWGGEIFKYQSGRITRLNHLPYQKHILGDKMVNEARISALSFFHSIPDAKQLLKEKFTDIEWEVYTKQINSSSLFTSSMGRLFDAVASIIGLIDIGSYHGQAAILLEAKALSYKGEVKLETYNVFDSSHEFKLEYLLSAIIKDKIKLIDESVIALRFHLSLVAYIQHQLKTYNSHKITFSGGVFQNKLLVNLLIEKLSHTHSLYFHKTLSPNDESVSFGQLMHYLHIPSNTQNS